MTQVQSQLQASARDRGSKTPRVSHRMFVCVCLCVCVCVYASTQTSGTNVHICPLVGELQPVSLTHLSIISSPRTSSGSQDPRVPNSVTNLAWPFLHANSSLKALATARLVPSLALVFIHFFCAEI